MAHNPFDKLKELKLKKKPLAPPVKKPAAPVPPAPPVAAENEDEIFARAMAGIKPLGGEQQKGRGVHPAPPQTPVVSQADALAEGRAQLLDLVAGKVEFELTFTDEYVQGYVKDLDTKIFRQLRTGALSPEAHLDLHGHNAVQARDAVIAFLKSNYLSGRRCLLLIPGRGANSPGGLPVLKEEIKSWLTRDPLKRVVLAFCTAQPRHGGAGALYVLLRARKKTGGKIRWERDIEDFE
jgi:DNA-nicking Smr family endonuclease